VLLPLTACASPLVCDGAAELCELRLDEVVLPATHNSMSNLDEGWLGPNQQHPPARQLEDGVRGMLLDTYWEDDEAKLCHGSCAFGSTPLHDVLAQMDAFLDANPGEVLVLVFEDGITPEQTEDAFRDAGLFDRVIVPPADGVSWPTLGELVQADTRVLATRESGGPGPDWYRPFYDLGYDTPYTYRSADEFTCDVLRGDPSHALYLINHWISDPLPDREADAVVNRADVLGERVDDCTARWGRKPNLVAVDFYDEGDLIEVVRAANGL
jgi:hypothetical protein